MGVFKAFSVGLGKSIRVKKIILFVFLTNLVLGLVLAIPMYETLQNSFGNTVVRDDMMHGFNFRWFTEFRSESSGFINSFSPSMIGIGAILNNIQSLFYGLQESPLGPVVLLSLVFMIINTFFSGGLLEIYNSNERSYTMKEFFNGCGNYFFRFFRLMIFTVILYLVFVFWVRGLLDSLQSILTENSKTERLVVILGFVKDFIMIFLIFFIGMLFDYAKIKTVIEKGRWMFLETLKSAGFIFSNFFKVIGLYYLLAIMGLLFIVLYWVGHTYIPQETLWMIVVMIVVQQFYIMINIWVRFTLLGSEMAFYKGNVLREGMEETEEEPATTGIL